MRTLIALLACTTLAACAANSSRPTRAQVQRIDRALATAPGEAQPGKIVARELEFARAAKDNGQWTAFREFAAPGAKLHGPDGLVDAESWLRGRKNPKVAVKWSPRNIWMSCDATVAVSHGRHLNADGKVGSFVTVWQRQSDRTYLWTYAIAALDDPQPVPDPEEPLDENAIVVTAIDSIEGKVADCARPDSPTPPQPIELVADSSRYEVLYSPDKTLRYGWEHRADGKRVVLVRMVRDGVWPTVLDFTAPSSLEQ